MLYEYNKGALDFAGSGGGSVSTSGSTDEKKINSDTKITVTYAGNNDHVFLESLSM